LDLLTFGFESSQGQQPGCKTGLHLSPCSLFCKIAFKACKVASSFLNELLENEITRLTRLIAELQGEPMKPTISDGKLSLWIFGG
jgi:hypothetical protein